MTDDQNANVVITADTSQYSANVSQATDQTNKLGAAVDTLSAKLDGLTKRAGKKLILFGTADLVAMGAFTKMAASHEAQLKSLDAALVGTNRSLSTYDASINKMARDMPVATSQIIQLVTQLNKMGIQSSQSADAMSRTFLKLGAATTENVNALTDSMIQLNKQMGTLASGSGAVQGFSNSLLAVSKAGGVSAQGVLDFSQALAPIARTAGITEKQVLGISAAFTSAGQDGFYAANTFNTMLSDITRAIHDGSPEITKYSNLLGVTADQFKKMSASDQMVGLFETIAKQGPNAIRILDQLGIDGIRASKAIQGVVQTGDLRNMIGTSVAAYGGNGVNDSAAAAWSGMDSELQKMQNNLSQIGDAIGSNLVAPATSALGVFNAMLSTVNQIAQPILAMGGVLATVVGGTALGGGAVGATLSTFGKIAMAGYVLRSRPVRGVLGGLKAGFQEGSGQRVTGLGSAMDEAYTAGQMPRYQSMPYLAARGFGAGIGSPNAGGQNYFGRALSAPFRLLSWGARGTADFYGDSATMGEDRPVAFRDRLTQNARVSGVVASERVRLRGVARDLEGQVASGAMDKAAAKAALDSEIQLSRAAARAAGTMDQLAVSGKEAAGALLGAARANVRAGMSNLGSVAGSAMGGLRSLIGGPMGALFAGMALWQMKQNADETKNAPIPDAARNPITEYNAALGLSTDKLVTFSDALVTASKNYQTVNDALSDVASAAKLAAADQTVTSSVAKNLQSGNIAQGTAYLRSISGQLTPQNTQSVIADIYRRYSKADADAILRDFTRNRNYGTGNQDISSFVTGAQDLNGGWSGLFAQAKGGQTDESMLMSGSVAGNISTAASGAAATGGTFTGQQVQASLLTKTLSEIVRQQGAGKLENDVATKQVKGLEDTFFGGKQIGFSGATKGAFGTAWATAAAKYIGKPADKLTDDDVKKWLKEKAIPDNPALKEWYDAQVSQGIDPFMDTSKAYTTSHASTDPVVQLINSTGLGGFAKNNSAVQFGIGEGFASPKAQTAAVTSMLSAGISQGGGSQAKTILSFDKLISAINLSSDRLSQFAQAAWDAFTVLSKYQQGNMTPGQAIGTDITNQSALINAPTTDANAAAQNTAKQTRAADLASVRDYYKQYALALYQYQKQTDRSTFDYNRSVSRANQSFRLQQIYAEQDYYRQRMYNQEDFNKSMKRAAEDASKTVYNPWERVYSQLTVGAQSVAQNMEDQNKMIQGQIRNLSQAHRAGLSQQTIDTLDLSNPQNSQQLQAIMDDIANNPQVVARLNKAAAIRATGVKALTQSNDNVQYRRALADYATSVSRSDALFKQSQERATKQFNISMGQMAEDHATAMKRAQEDMNDYGKVIAGNFSKVDTYVQSMMKHLGLSNQYVSDMAKLLKSNPELSALLKDPNFGLTQSTGGNAPATVTGSENSGPARGMVTQSGATINSNSRVTYVNTYTLEGVMIASNNPKDLASQIEAAARYAALTKTARRS